MIRKSVSLRQQAAQPHIEGEEPSAQDSSQGRRRHQAASRTLTFGALCRSRCLPCSLPDSLCSKRGQGAGLFSHLPCTNLDMMVCMYVRIMQSCWPVLRPCTKQNKVPSQHAGPFAQAAHSPQKAAAWCGPKRMTQPFPLSHAMQPRARSWCSAGSQMPSRCSTMLPEAGLCTPTRTELAGGPCTSCTLQMRALGSNSC